MIPRLTERKTGHYVSICQYHGRVSNEHILEHPAPSRRLTDLGEMTRTAHAVAVVVVVAARVVP